MRTVNLLILSCFLFVACSLRSQNSCAEKDVLARERKFNKAEKKEKAYTDTYAVMAFDIAECYRQSNDSAASKWYRNYLRVSKASYGRCGDMENTARVLFRMGFSSYYLANYKEAESYFEKSIAANGDVESHYYLGLTLMKLNKWQEAKVELINYQTKSSSHIQVDSLIKTCEDKIDQ